MGSEIGDLFRLFRGCDIPETDLSMIGATTFRSAATGRKDSQKRRKSQALNISQLPTDFGNHLLAFGIDQYDLVRAGRGHDPAIRADRDGRDSLKPEHAKKRRILYRLE